MFSRAFQLAGADEYTLTYMENNKHIYVMADAEAAAGALRAQVRVGGRMRVHVGMCGCAHMGAARSRQSRRHAPPPPPDQGP